MSRSRTRRHAGRARQRHPGPWAHRLAWLAGAALVGVGALIGAFGTVAWLPVRCASSLAEVLFGMLALGVAPVVGGGALLWAGLSVLEAQSARSRVRSIADDRLIEATQGGATSAVVALRLGIGDVVEVEHRLDALVARDALVLVVSDEGEALYRAP